MAESGEKLNNMTNDGEELKFNEEIKQTVDEINENSVSKDDFNQINSGRRNSFNYKSHDDDISRKSDEVKKSLENIIPLKEKKNVKF